MKLTQYLQNCDKSLRSSAGFTLLEILAVTFLGSIIISLVLSATLTNRFMLSKDIVRTRLTQNLRGTLDIIGLDARIAGQSLTGTFPAVEVQDGGANPDTLILRRSVIDQILPLCQAIAAGTTANSRVYFAAVGTQPGCAYAGQTYNFNAWKTYRTANGGAVDAYIYDTATKLGEFFIYQGETNGTSSYYLQTNGATFANAYNTSSSAIYILESWNFLVQNGMLEVIKNELGNEVQNVSFGITNFQVTIPMQDATIKTSLTRNDNWTQMASLVVTVTGSDEFDKRTVIKSLTSEFFPRNILSN